ncbi:MAG: hypothetical protein AAGI52_03140 [Bacteroidota bacterium]
MKHAFSATGLLVAVLLARAAAAQTPLGTFAEVDRPEAILALTDDRVLVDGPGQVFAFTADGAPLGPFNPASLSQPLVQLSDGRVLVTDGDDLRAFASDGTSLGTLIADLDGPAAAVELTDGRILVAEVRGFDQNGRVSAFEPDGTPLRPFVRVQNASSQPLSLAQLPDGRVLVSYLDGSVGVQAYAPDGTPLGPFSTDISRGVDLLELPDGRILVSGLSAPSTNGTLAVGVLSASGEYLGVFAEEGLGTIGGLAYLSDGRVLVADRTNDVIRAYGVIPVASEPEPGAAAVSEAYPSPVRAGMPAALAVTLATPGTVTVAVFDATGREFWRRERVLSAGRQSVEIATANWAPGVYAVRVSGAGVEAVRRLAVVR